MHQARLLGPNQLGGSQVVQACSRETFFVILYILTVQSLHYLLIRKDMGSNRLVTELAVVTTIIHWVMQHVEGVAGRQGGSWHRRPSQASAWGICSPCPPPQVCHWLCCIP